MSVKKKISDFQIDSLEYTDLYLFGSSLISNDFGDIDIAIIYDKTKVGLEKIIEYRRKIQIQIFEIFNCDSDILLMSTEEEREMQFLMNAKNKKIKKNLHIEC